MSSWIAALASEIRTHGRIESEEIEDIEFRMREVQQHGPALFHALAIEARTAAHMLSFQFGSAANWFMVKNTAMPFRMLRAILDVQSMGIALVYTLGSLKAGENPKEQRDFLDIRVQPPENYLILVYQGTPVSPATALETMFRNAFLPK